jgi:hypothetical protein
MKQLFDLFTFTATPIFNAAALWMLLRRRKAVGLTVTLTAICLTLGVSFSFLPIYDRYPALFMIVSLPMFAVVVYCFEGTVWQKLFATWSVFNVSVTIGFSSSPIAAALAPYGSEAFYGYLMLLMAALYITEMLLVHRFLRGFFHNLFSVSGGVWILYLLGAVVARLMLRLIAAPSGIVAVTDPPPVGDGGVYQYYLVILASVWCFVSACLAIVATRRRLDAVYEERSMRSALIAARSHYAVLSQSLDEARRLRHDIKYAFASIARLAERGDDAGILALLNAEGISDNPRRFCEHNIADALLNWYAERCEAEEISFEVAAQLPKDAPIEAGDLCVLLGNLLENAYEGAGRVEGKGRYIAASIKAEPRMLTLSIENGFDGVLLRDGEQLQSRKLSGGVGLKSVRSVCDRYGGEYLFECSGREFRALAWLNW